MVYIGEICLRNGNIHCKTAKTQISPLFGQCPNEYGFIFVGASLWDPYGRIIMVSSERSPATLSWLATNRLKPILGNSLSILQAFVKHLNSDCILHAEH